MSAQVEQHATDLFYGLLTYVGDAPGVESVVLPRRLWKEAVCEGDGGAPQPSGDNRAERTEAAGEGGAPRPSVDNRVDRTEAAGEPPAAFARRADRPAYAVRYHAGTGVHRVEWDGRTVWVVVAVAQRPTGYSMPEYLRSVIVYMPKVTATDGGVCDSGGVKTTTRTLLTAFIRNVVEWNALRVDQLSHTHYKMYRYSTECRGNNRWVEEGLHPSRSLESVIMPPKIREDLVKDAQAFLEPGAREWYTAKGVPYRRCYFLHGPPGTGKSSFVRALAGKLRLPVAFLQAASTGMSDSLLADAFRDVPRNGVLVLEDLDCLFTPATGGGGQADGARHARLGVNLTLAGLLNALDGLVSGPSGRITVLTSNHPKLLDSALLRPGRVDVTAAFQHPERQELVALFRSFYPAAADEKDAEGFADAVLGGNFAEATRSVATLQQLFIKHRTELAKTVVEDVVLFLEKVEKGASATGLDGGRTRALPI